MVTRYRFYILGIVFLIPGDVRIMFLAICSIPRSKCSVWCSIECTAIQHIANQRHGSVVLATFQTALIKHTVNL